MLASATIDKPTFEVPPKRATLFALTVEGQALLHELQAALEESQGEVTAEIEALLAEKVSHDGDVNAKLESVGFVIKELRAQESKDAAQAASYAAQLEALKLRSKRKGTAADALEARVLDLVKSGGETKVETASHTFKINKIKPSVVLLVDVEKLPLSYLRVKKEADKIKLAEALKIKNPLALKVARLSEQGEKLKVS